jgi:hypothetical protein
MAKHTMTAARIAALKLAQKAAAEARRGRALAKKYHGDYPGPIRRVKMTRKSKKTGKRIKLYR